jgi:hypothetical protein
MRGNLYAKVERRHARPFCLLKASRRSALLYFFIILAAICTGCCLTSPRKRGEGARFRCRNVFARFMIATMISFVEAIV